MVIVTFKWTVFLFAKCTRRELENTQVESCFKSVISNLEIDFRMQQKVPLR